MCIDDYHTCAQVRESLPENNNDRKWCSSVADDVQECWGQPHDRVLIFEEQEVLIRNCTFRAFLIIYTRNIIDRCLGTIVFISNVQHIIDHREYTAKALSDSQFVRDGFVIECAEHVEDFVVRLQ